MNALLRLLAVIVAGTLLLTGCSSSAGDGTGGGSDAAPDGVVIIAGVHANMPAAQVPVELAPLLEAAVRREAPITVIANDGTPAVVFHVSGYTITTANPEATSNDIDGVTTAVLGAVKNAKADSDGNDLGAALSVARDQVAADQAVAASIMVIDSGLSDRGFPLMTTPGILTAGTGKTIVEFAQKNSYLPTMPKGTSVTLVGLGYGTAPQPDLTPIQRDAVKDVWRSFLEAAGATVILIDKPRTGAGPETTFTTTLVEPGTYEQFTVERSGAQTTITLRSVNFEPDSPALTDTADGALQQIVSMIDAASGPVTITGHTDVGSTGHPGGLAGLSLDRAESVKEWLVTHGVEASRIATAGVGSDEPLYPHPATDEERAANRRVLLTFGESP